MVIIAAAGRGCTRPIAAPGKAVGAQKPVLPGCHKEFSEVRVNPDGFLTRIINSIRGRVEYAAPRFREEGMPDNFDQLCTSLAQIDLFGTAGDAFPDGAAAVPTDYAVRT